LVSNAENQKEICGVVKFQVVCKCWQTHQ